MPGPLSHLRVLDLSRIMAGPWASQVLADLGADVIKVERPGAGDDTRSWGPPFLKQPDGTETREAGYYLSVNRGKRSITLSLDKPEGQRIVRALAARADILLENYKVGTLPRFGLGYEDLKKINPKLIYCSVTGFGQTGPRRDQAAYDFLIQAMGGLMSITGERDDKPGGGPQKVGIPIVDIMTGMYAAVAMLAAVARREVSGQGEYIDIGMLDVQIGFLANQAMNHLVSGKTPQRSGNAPPMWSRKKACVRAYCSVRSTTSVATVVLRSAPRTVPMRIAASSPSSVIAASSSISVKPCCLVVLTALALAPRAA